MQFHNDGSLLLQLFLLMPMLFVCFGGIKHNCTVIFAIWYVILRFGLRCNNKLQCDTVADVRMHSHTLTHTHCICCTAFDLFNFSILNCNNLKTNKVVMSCVCVVSSLYEVYSLWFNALQIAATELFINLLLIKYTNIYPHTFEYSARSE